jgi:hypothetical protein
MVPRYTALAAMQTRKMQKIESCACIIFWLAISNHTEGGNAQKKLPRGVTVAQEILILFDKVRILAG